MKNNPLQVHWTRGAMTESTHIVDAVVIDSKGLVRAQYGLGGEAKIYPRSAIKIFQALPLVLSGAADFFQLSSEHLALACASHFGEPQHTDIVHSWLKKISSDESQLVCAAHLPLGEKGQQFFWKNNDSLHRWHNNCSGKHCGLISSLLFRQIDAKNYQSYDHPIQIEIRHILSILSGESMEQTAWAVDGCELPTYATSLRGLARMWSHLLQENLENSSLPNDMSKSLTRLKLAMIQHPYLVGGAGSMCTDVISATSGNVLIKIGAEGVYAGMIERAGLAFALKVRDGHMRASKAALAYLVDQHSGFSEQEKLKLQSYLQPQVLTWGQNKVGQVNIQTN